MGHRASGDGRLGGSWPKLPWFTQILSSPGRRGGRGGSLFPGQVDSQLGIIESGGLENPGIRVNRGGFGRNLPQPGRSGRMGDGPSAVLTEGANGPLEEERVGTAFQGGGWRRGGSGRSRRAIGVAAAFAGRHPWGRSFADFEVSGQKHRGLRNRGAAWESASNHRLRLTRSRLFSAGNSCEDREGCPRQARKTRCFWPESR